MQIIGNINFKIDWIYTEFSHAQSSVFIGLSKQIGHFHFKKLFSHFITAKHVCDSAIKVYIV